MSVPDQLAEFVRAGLRAGEPVDLLLERAWVELGVPRWIYGQVRAASTAAMGGVLGVGKAEAAAAWSALMDDAQVRRYVSNASAALRADVAASVRAAIADGEALTAAARRLGDAADLGISALRADVRALASTPITAKTAKSLMRKIDAGVKSEALRAAYARVATAAVKAVPGGVERAISHAVVEKARSRAERIMRTESERAAYAAETEMIARDPDVRLVRIVRGPGHTVRDICDAVATADCGYGAGIYPLTAAPVLPLHPNCGCFIQGVHAIPKGGMLSKAPGDAIVRAAERQEVKGAVSLTQIRPRTGGPQ